MESGNGLFLIYLACASVFVIPLILGIILFRRCKDGLGIMAVWLTLKPLLTTPLWILILGLFNENHVIAVFASILPGALLSLAAFKAFRPLFGHSQTRWTARRLLILDCVRWLNTLAIMLLPGGMVWYGASQDTTYEPLISALF